MTRTLTRRTLIAVAAAEGAALALPRTGWPAGDQSSFERYLVGEIVELLSATEAVVSDSDAATQERVNVTQATAILSGAVGAAEDLSSFSHRERVVVAWADESAPPALFQSLFSRIDGELESDDPLLASRRLPQVVTTPEGRFATVPWADRTIHNNGPGTHFSAAVWTDPRNGEVQIVSFSVGPNLG